MNSHKFHPKLIKRQKFHIFDVGAGDFKFSEHLLRSFLQEGFKADMTTIDLEADQSEWNAQQGKIGEFNQNLN